MVIFYMQDIIRWGILGPGIIANTFAHCLREVPDARITAVGSRNIERSKAFCEKYGGKPYGTYEDLVNDSEVDVIYVATPHHLREEHVCLCVKAGKAVLSEKPFAANEKQAVHMYAEAGKANVFVMDGLWSRFLPAWEFAGDFIHSGKLGKIHAIVSSTSWNSKREQIRLFDPALCGGALLDAGIYSLAAASFLMGDEYPSVIKAISDMGKSGVDEHDVVSMQYPSGTLFAMMCGIPGYLHETHVMMEKGTVTIPRHRNPCNILIREPQVSETWQTGELRDCRFPYVDEGFQYEAIHVQDCLRKGLKTSPRVTPKESLALMRISDEIRRQANFVYPFEV
jgi:predicted dehydrogenase